MPAISIFTVACSACETQFPVDPAKVPPGGVRARCSACGAIFRVEGAADERSAPPPESTADRVGVASFPEAGPDPDTGPEPWSGVIDEIDDAADDRIAADPGEQPGSTVFLDEPPEPEIDASWREDAPAAADEIGIAGGEGVEAAGSLHEADAAEDTLHDVDDLPPSQSEAAVDTFPGEPPDLPISAAPEAPVEEPTPLPESFQFGRRDPHEKARRLARVLVSDIITYNPERYLRALENDSLREDFDDEIRKSWAEYVEQVGPDLARGTGYWRDALNDLLARGRDVF